MKIAYLILAHNNATHLKRMIHSLSAPESYFYIHIDGKVDETPFKQLLPEQANIVYLRQRENIYWGGMGIIRATLNLLLEAESIRPDYFCFLNIADFPIKSQSEIRELLATQKEWIRVDRSLTDIKQFSQVSHITKKNFCDTPSFHALAHCLPMRVYKRLVYKSLYLTRIIGRKNILSPNITPYQGSSWWSLSHQCVAHILSFVTKYPTYIDSFKYSFAPDEIFFHTIIKNSPFADQICHDFDSNTALGNHHGSHYIDWTRGKNLPRTLVTEDFSDLMHSSCLFARKFDSIESACLLQKLEIKIARH